MSLIAYISGSMSGCVNNNVEAFNEAAKLLREKGYTVNNPAEVEIENGTYDQYIEADLKLLCKSHVMFQLEGWENSRGANIEYGYARGSHISIVSFDKWKLIADKIAEIVGLLK